MLNINTNITSLIAQNNLTKANSLVKTSIERLSTGFRINRASDDAANMSIAKNMNCQISGTDVAIDNTQQATNLLQTADGALDNMQNNLLRVRDLTVQALNGTYSSAEKAMIQDEINNLIEETYKQRNNTMFNKINIFGSEESPDGGTATSITAAAGGTGGAGATQATGGTKPITPLTEEEAIAQGYTCIHNEAEFANIKDDTYGKYCLMGDIDFSQVSNWGSVSLDGELNGNGYSINNLNQCLFSDYYGTIKNLNLNNVNIDIADASWNNVGALVTNNYGTIDNCSVSGTVNVGENSNATGGLVGHNFVTITNCSSSATVTGVDTTGGIVGINDGGTITDCSSSATVTGSDYTGGLVGDNAYGSTITNCSSSATVTGDSHTGGLVGLHEGGTIDKSYSTGNVSGTTGVGGLIGYDYWADVSNSYALGDVNGNSNVGGFIGTNNGGIINTSYSTGTTTGTGSNVGGFVGTYDSSPGNISNSYTTSELNFSGANIDTISDCHGTKAQTGVTAHDASWFEDGSNLSFLGDAFDTSVIPPDIIGNERPKPPTPSGTETVFQIGANSGEENTLTIDTGFSLNGLKANVLTIADGEKTLNDIDAALENISTFRATIGATQNRLESVSQSLLTRKNNMEASHSTIMDTDYGFETSKLVKNQILQNVTASLLAQANTNPEIALRLL